MSAKTYLRFTNKVDVYQRITGTNDAGQKTASFQKVATVSAFFQSKRTERRLEPYVDNIDEYEFYVSYKDASFMQYNNRLENVVDRYGNVIEEGPLEIVSVQKYIGYKGRMHHLLVTTRRVVEVA